MVQLRSHVDSFRKLFSGNPDAYGIHTPEPTQKEGEKAKGKSTTLRKPVQDSLYFKHLHGQLSLGIAPLRKDGKLKFAAIDVDEYPIVKEKYLTVIARGRLPMIPVRSKSGGLHLYIFFTEYVDADKVLDMLDVFRHLFSLPDRTEIFPKQKYLTGNSVGNWINLPYYGGIETERYAYGLDGRKLSLDEFVKLALQVSIQPANLPKVLANLPIAPGPPCLQALYLQDATGDGERNVFLFQCAVYLKARFGDGFPDKVHLLNRGFSEPLEYSEVDTTVIASNNKTDYTYQCRDPILKEYCYKNLCIQREFGINSGEISNISYGQLIKIDGVEPYYEWEVNGQPLVFESTEDLKNQSKFQSKCIEVLYVFPKQMKTYKWQEIINNALSSMEVKTAEEEGVVTTDTLWYNKAGDYFARQPAPDKEGIAMGLCYHDTKAKKVYFSGEALIDYLDDSKQFSFSRHVHRQLLKKMGAVGGIKMNLRSKQIRGWMISVKDLNKYGIYLPSVRLAAPIPPEYVNNKKPKKEKEEGFKPSEDIKDINFVDDEEKF